jgi:hypothetical protein
VVEPYEPRIEFLAFFHVWSDALGSVSKKGLSSCQVAYLSKLTRATSGLMPFWIDGLLCS